VVTYEFAFRAADGIRARICPTGKVVFVRRQ
jgi:hypothetical protein